MNIVYRRFRLGGIPTKLGNFLLINPLQPGVAFPRPLKTENLFFKRKFSYDLVTKPSNYFVKSFLNSHSFQETRASSTIPCETNRADKIILNIFDVTM